MTTKTNDPLIKESINDAHRIFNRVQQRANQLGIPSEIYLNIILAYVIGSSIVGFEDNEYASKWLNVLLGNISTECSFYGKNFSASCLLMNKNGNVTF